MTTKDKRPGLAGHGAERYNNIDNRIIAFPTDAVTHPSTDMRIMALRKRALAALESAVALTTQIEHTEGSVAREALCQIGIAHQLLNEMQGEIAQWWEHVALDTMRDYIAEGRR